VLKEENPVYQESYMAKLSLKSDEEIKIFPDKKS
jgi:hypothetical protein